MDHRGSRIVAFGQWAGVAGRFGKTLGNSKCVSGVRVHFLFPVFISTSKQKTQRNEKGRSQKVDT